MNLGSNRWIAIAAGVGLLAVVVVGWVLVSHRGTSRIAAATTSLASGSRPSAAASPSKSSRTASPGGHATPHSGGNGTPTAAPPSYQFNPPVSGSGQSLANQFVAADLNGNRQIIASFSVNGAGTVSLHGFGSIGGLSACLEYGQGCSPVSVPNPAYWTLTSDDLAHVGTNFRIRVNLPGGLAGIDVGWNGSHALSLSNVGMNGSTSGYTAGAGVRYRVATGGTVSVSSGAGGAFHLKARDKATGAVVPPSGDITFAGSASISLAPPDTWTIYLWSESAANASPTISWP